jgi:phospholipid/cholesterol/gamma-HCH transport system permease protein
MRALVLLGARARGFVLELGRLAYFAAGVGRAIVVPPLRGREIVDEVYKLGVLSIVIIGVSGFAVGMVLGLQGYNTLVRFGATNSLGAVVGLSLIRELGPVLTALLATGRAGSATAAEIGTMAATEQLDGLRMMSVDPMHYVVMPRATAMVVVMPLLAALFIVAGLAGGWVVGVLVMKVDPGSYVGGLESAVEFTDDVLGALVKAVAFGALVGLIATQRGYTCQHTSAGVSRATTSTVVVASVSILVVDYVITALWGV